MKKDEKWILTIGNLADDQQTGVQHAHGVGPVELMQAACRVAGVKYTYHHPEGEIFCTQEQSPVWREATSYFYGWRLVIPTDKAQDPCPNCQNVKPGYARAVSRKWKSGLPEEVCSECGRPKSEWTYAHYASSVDDPATWIGGVI